MTEAVMDIETWLDQHGQTVVDVMYPDGDAPEDFDVSGLVKQQDRLVLKIATQDRAAVIKAFQPQAIPGLQRTDRELLIFLALRETRLIPAIQTYSQTDKWLMAEWMDGFILENALSAENAPALARALGRWFAGYTDVMRHHGIQQDTNWWLYLKTDEDSSHRPIPKEEEAFLKALPIRTWLIAKNDMDLSHFLFAKEGHLVGLDFEHAQLKPYGWDMLMMVRMLIHHYPDRREELTLALMQGWGQGTDCLSSEEFQRLLQIFTFEPALAQENELAIAL